VAPGSTVGGRYVLRRRLDDDLGAERWLAQDTTLDRSVELCVMPTDHPRADAVLDAARRAAGVADQRLVRVLDAVSEGPLTLVVTEWVDGTRLTDLVRRAPMPADQARTLVGETALALEQARHRGLHHRCLTSDHVLRLDDGTVKVAGVAVEAALHGLEGDDGDVASRDDTLALVALAYAALTGYWPSPRRTIRTDPISGPISIGHPAVPGQPPDHTGAPWRPSLLPPAPQVSGAAVAPAQIVSGVPADLDTLCIQAFAGPGAPDTPGDLAGQIAPWGDAVRVERRAGSFPLALGPTPLPPPTAPTRATGSTRPSGHPAVRPAGPPSTVTQGPPTARLPVVPPVAASGPASHPPTSRPPASPAAPPRRGAASRAAASRTPGAGPGTDPGTGPEWGDLFEVPKEQPAPLLPPTPLNRPPGRQTRTVIILVAAFLTLMLLLAKCGLSGLGDNAFIKNHTRAPDRTSAGTPSATASTPPTTSGETSTGDGPIRIVAVHGFDPQGDGSEKESITDRAVDGDPKTSWTSDTYKSAEWGGLKKGVGLRLDLGSDLAVHQVTLTVPDSGADVELRTVTGNDLTGSAVVATANGITGTVTLTPSSPVTTRYLVIWFT
jgi:hypothetical protein